MKSALNKGKKVLSVFMAVLMVLTAWVFVAPEKAEAAAGSYKVVITYHIDNRASANNNTYTGKSSFNESSDKNNKGGISLFYKTNNGTGTEYEVYWDVGNSGLGKGQASGTEASVTAPGGHVDSKKGDYTAEATIPGFPTWVYACWDYNAGTKGVWWIKSIVVKNSNGTNAKTLWSGKGYLNSSNQQKYIYITTENSGRVGNDSSYAYVTTDSGYADTWKNNYPVSPLQSLTVNPTSYTIPKTGASNLTIQFQYTSAKSDFTDQYGVECQTPVFYVPVNQPTSLSEAKVDRTGNGIVSMSSSGLLTVSSDAQMAGTTNSKTIWVSAYSVSSWKTMSITLNDPQYTVKFYNKESGSSGNSAISTQSIYYGCAATTPDSSKNPTKAYDTTNHYTFNTWDRAYNNITSNLDVYPTFIATPHSYTKTTAKAATCTATGNYKYTCSCGYNYTGSGDIAALGHSYGSATYIWADNGSTCTGKRTCTRSGCTNYVTATGTVTSSVKTAATCTTMGVTRYTATFTDTVNYSTQTKDVQDIAALDHSYGSATFTWGSDYSTCTGKRTCTRSGCTAYVTASGTVTSKVQTAATCTAKGVTKYTATFTDTTNYPTQTKEVTNIAINSSNHDWNSPTYTWSNDGKTCVATRTCKRDTTNHQQTETAKVENGRITSGVQTAATCTAKGTTRYTATFTNTAFLTQTKDVQDIAALGHSYGSATYTWADNGSTCTGRRNCTRSGCSNYVTANGTVTSKVQTAATCTAMGVTRYTATFTDTNYSTQTKDITNIPVNANNHDWGSPSYEWANNGSTCTGKRVCKRNSSHVETVSGTVTSSTLTAANCTTIGTTRYTATFSNGAYSTQTKDIQDIPKNSVHNYTNNATTANLKSAATCTSPAVYYKSCSRCGTKSSETFTSGSVDANNHNYTENATEANLKTAATCTSAAVYYKSCSRCGLKSSATFSSGSSLGHDFGGAYVNKGSGVHARKCKRSGCTATGIGSTANITEACSGGSATCTASPVCTLCHTAYGSESGHKFNGAYASPEKGKHYQKCTRTGCNEYGIGTTAGATDSCSGGTATCTVAGKCSKCNTNYIDALGHIGGTAYCKTLAVCSRCSTSYGSYNASNHQAATNKSAVAATCLAVGYTAGVYCSACSTWVSGHTTVAKLSHSYTGTEAQSQNNGTHLKKCVNGCNQYGGTAVACTYGAWVNNDPNRTKTCTVCGYSVTERITYTISYTLGGGTNNASNPATYNYDSATITLKDPTKTGYTFTGWTGSNGSTAQKIVTIPKGSTGNMSYTANWTATSYKINYTLAGGTNNSDNPASYTIESGAITLKDPTRTGYTFTGWTGDNGSTPQKNVKIPAGSTGVKNYTANWQANTYTVTYNANGGSGTMANSTHTYDVEKALTANAYTKNYTVKYNTNGANAIADSTVAASFSGWKNGAATYSDGATVKNLTATNNGNVTLTAIWSNGSVTLPTPTKAGYTFEGWYDALTGDNKVANGGASYSPSANVTLYAHWSLNSYNINYVLGEGATASGNPATYTVESGAITLNDPTRTGYTFTGWTGSNGSTAQKNVKIPAGSTGDKTYTANWSPINYTISYDLKGGTVEPANKANYNIETETFTLTEPTKEGYTFTGWTGSNGTTAQKNVSIEKGSTGDKTYTAKWSINSYKVVFKNDDGTVLQETNEVYGTTPSYSGATPTKAPDASYHYTFKIWSPAIHSVQACEDGDTANVYTATYNSEGHSFTYEKISEEQHKKTCDCGYTANENHSGGSASCTEAKVCDDCEEAYGNANGHSVETVERKENTCLASGNKAYTYCSVCDVILTIDGDNVEASGFKKSTDSSEYVLDKKNHEYTGIYKYTENSTTHTRQCVNGCGNYGATEEHNFNYSVVTTPNTCTTDGFTTYTCVCGASRVDDQVSMKGHNWKVVSWDWEDDFSEARVNLVCNNDSTETATVVANLSSETASADCQHDVIQTFTATAKKDGQTFTTTKPKNLGKGPHDFTNEVVDEDYLAAAATCLVPDLYYKSCTVCELSSKETEFEATFENGSVNANNHVTEGRTPVEAKDATCLTFGWDAYENCPCGAKLGYNEIARLEHSYTGESVQYYKNNTHLKQCVNGCDQYGGVVIDCSFGEWEEKTDVYERTCSVCAHVDSTPIIEADYTAYDNAVAELEAMRDDSRTSDEDKAAITALLTAEENILERNLREDEVNKQQHIINEAVERLQYKLTELNEKLDSEYTLIFKNYDGTVIAGKTYAYGSVIDEADIPTTASKPTDNEYVYTFNGWDKEIPTVANSSETFTAQYTSTPREYAVTFFDEDGTTVLSQKNDYHYGDDTVIPAAPANYEDDANEYTFAGWSPAVSEKVQSDASYVATYAANQKMFTVTFKNEDLSVISTAKYAYGVKAAKPANPVKASTPSSKYTFAGWTPEFNETVTGDAEYVASFTESKIKYTVTFVDYDGTVLDTQEYNYGATVTPPSEPSRTPDEAYNYTFAGWTPTVEEVSGNATYTATYDAENIKYTVTFINADETVISTKQYNYGDTVVVPSNPKLDATETKRYTFKGWDKPITAVTEDNTVYKATYNETEIKYTVIFLDYDASVLSETEYSYGDAVTPPSEPSRTPDKVNTYTFAGWSPTVEEVSGNATYTATYNAKKIKYTVTFENYDGTVISTNEYNYGDTVVIPEGTPEKTADNTYTYRFKGWSPKVTDVRGETTYTAVYEPVYKNYTVIFKDGENILSTTKYHYGERVVTPNDPKKNADETNTYTFAGWSPDVEEFVTAGKTYSAQYTATPILYTVKFVDYDNSVISSAEYTYGANVTPPTEPTRDDDGRNTYEFSGWDKEITNVTGNVTYKATYTSTANVYTVDFINDDETLISSNTYNYGDAVVRPANPTKDADGEYTYEFAGWDKEIAPVTGDAQYKATYTKSYIEYEVKFVYKDADGNEKVVVNENTHFGQDVNAPTAADVANYFDSEKHYTFANAWTVDGTAATVNDKVNGNVTYVAVYSESAHDFSGEYLIENDTHSKACSKGCGLYGNTEGHSYEFMTTPATCVSEGYTVYTCTECHKTYTSDYVAATGHSWEVSIVWADDNLAATANIVCTNENCDETDTKSATVTSSQTSPDCQTNISIVYTAEVEFDGETYTDTKTVESQEKGEHVFAYIVSDDTLVEEATCMTVAVYKMSCRVCGKLSDETFKYGEKNSENHEGAEKTDVEAMPPKCNAVGWDAYQICECGAKIGYNELPQIEHDYSGETVFLSKGNATHYAQCINGCELFGGDPIECTFGEWTAKETYYERACTGCGYTETTPIVPADYSVYESLVASLNEILNNPEIEEADAEAIENALEENVAASGLCEDAVKQEQSIIDEKVAALEAVYTERNEKYNKPYKVTFKDEDGTVIAWDYYMYGETVKEPTKPTKDADETYTYEFKKWDKDVVEVVKANAEYTAEYKETYINYTVTFNKYDGTEFAKYENLHYGDRISTPDENPLRGKDEAFEYVFSGWTPEFEETVTGNALYTAVYSQTDVPYTVKFIDYNGDVITERNDYHYLDTVIIPKDPSRDADKAMTYSFVGWKNLTTDTVSVDEKVSCSVTYQAVYDAEYINYTVKYENYDGTVLNKKTDCHYGDEFVYSEIPVREEDDVYTYEFSGWDSEVTEVNGDKTYIAQFNPIYKEYKVSFIDEDGTVLSEKTDYHYGDDVEVPTTTPTKAPNEYVSYEFDGWTPEVKEKVTSNTEYTATYRSTGIDYDVKFIVRNVDGSTMTIKNDFTHYDDYIIVPTNVNAYYNNAEEADKHYVFTGKWTLNGTETEVAETITGNATYVAVYEEQAHNYTDHYEKIYKEDSHKSYCVCGLYKTEECNGSGRTCTETAICDLCNEGYGTALGHAYGAPKWTWEDDFSCAVATFTCANDESHVYVSVSTNSNELLVSTTKKYATCTETGLVSHEAFVRFGGVVYSDKKTEVTAKLPHITEHNAAVKATCVADGTYENWYCKNCKTYFADEDCQTILDTPVETMIPHDFTGDYIYFDNGTHAKVCSYLCGTANLDGAKACNYTSWTLTRSIDGADPYYTKTCVDCGRPVTVFATKADYTAYNAKVAFLQSLFENDRVTPEDKAAIRDFLENNVLSRDLVADSDDLDKGKINEQNLVTQALMNIIDFADAYTEKYVGRYTVKFVDYDGRVISLNTYGYGDKISVPGAPAREATNEMIYRFIGWDKEITEVTEDITYTAVYSSEYIDYTVEFIGKDDEVISSNTYHYADELIMPSAEELAAASYTENGFTYTVKGWTNSVESIVVRNNTYTAIYSAPFDLSKAKAVYVKATDEEALSHYDHVNVEKINNVVAKLDALFEEYGIDIINDINPVESTNVEFASKLAVLIEELENILDKPNCTGHNYVSVVTAPTCIELGYTTKTCSKCDDVVVTDWKEIIDHDYKSIIYPATCTKQGYTTHTCTMCKDSYTDSWTECVPHDFDDVVTPPSCTKSGYTTHSCKNCDYAFVDSFTDPVDHEYEDEVTEPTCTAEGYTTHTCKICGESYVDSETAMIPHDYEETVTAPTCKDEGYTTYKCKVCGYTYVGEDKVLGPHDYKTTVVNPTCTEYGYTNYVCKVCGDSKIENFTEALGHSWNAVAEKKANCNGAGHSAYEECSRCHEKRGYTEYPATTHSYSETANKTASDGSYSWKTYSCANCSDKYVILTIIAVRADGKPASDAVVVISDSTGNKIVSGKTDANGLFTADHRFGNGTISVKVEDAANKMKAEGKLTVLNGNVTGDYTGGTGRLHSYGTTTENCTCNCHKTGFSKLLWSILNFFHKIFKMEKYRFCSCGEQHW